ncbi:MAG: hypothetical protein M0009_02835 [Deltaproteobacteria bacterium]|nr:hypothetical protein [Deltaproteobacteria bacterium]
MSHPSGQSWLRSFGQSLKAEALGVMIGFVAAFLLGRSVWLEMRANVGHAIPLFLAIAVFYVRWRRRPVRLAPFLFCEALAIALVLAIYGFSGSVLLIVPAALFRDGFHLGFLSLQEINLVLICSLAMVNAIWIGAALVRK